MIRAAAALVALALAAPAAARSVDYPADDAALLAVAAELKIAPVAALPARGAEDIALTVDPAADHVTMALGMYCSAYKVENPVHLLMPLLVAAWDRDGKVATAGGGSTITLHIASARSYRRCVELKEANARCITRVTIAGTVAANGRTLPVTGDAERDASVGGFCSSLARGIAVVSREAGIALIADARAKLATPENPAMEPGPPSVR